MFFYYGRFSNNIFQKYCFHYIRRTWEEFWTMCILRLAVCMWVCNMVCIRWVDARIGGVSHVSDGCVVRCDDPRPKRATHCIVMFAHSTLLNTSTDRPATLSSWVYWFRTAARRHTVNQHPPLRASQIIQTPSSPNNSPHLTRNVFPPSRFPPGPPSFSRHELYLCIH